MLTLTTLISALFLSIGVAYNAPKTNNYQHDDNIESPSMCADPSESDISHTNTFHFNDSNTEESGEYKNVGVETFELKYSDEKYENNTIRAAGYLYWKDDSNNNHPIQYVRVELYSTSYSGYVDYGYTDSSGHYSLYLIDSFANDLYIKVYCGNSNVTVKNASNNQYVYTSSTYYMVYPGSVAGIGWTVNMSSTIGQAFQVGQSVIMAARYAGEMNGSNLSNVNVKYPINNANNCYYNVLEQTIYIISTSTHYMLNTYASWDVIMHEYGHHVQNEFGLSDYSGGQHSFEDNLSDIYGKYTGIRFAWAEAYATVFAIMAQYYYSSQLQGISTVCNHDYNSYNNAYLNLETCVIDDDGNRAVSEACEASVAGVLWDMFDTYSSTESFDTLSMSHSDFWDLVTSSGATTLSDFIQYYYLSIDFNGKLAIGNLLSYYEISISDFLLTYVNSIPYFSWTKNGTSDTLQNNVFILSIHNSTGIQLLQKTVYNDYVQLSSQEWNAVTNSGYTSIVAIILAFQYDSSCVTGGYYSESLTIAI